MEPVFLILMVIGLVGLAMLAIPAFSRHGLRGSAHGHLPAHGHAHAPHLPAHGHAPHQELLAATTASSGIARWLPSPRGIFTALALYGAFGNALLEAFHLPALAAALGALLPTLIVERFAVRPLWNLVFKLQAGPSASLEELILGEATAVVPFKNGRGIVSTHREGRIVQLRACLSKDQASTNIKVGDRLRIEDVDAKHERVTVSVLDNE